MALTLSISEAAHKYGLDNYSDATDAAEEATLGAVTGYTTSFGDNPVIGQPSTIGVHFSGGYTATVAFIIRSAEFADLSVMSLVRTSTNEMLQYISGFSGVSTSALADLSNSAMFGGTDTLIGNSYNNILQGYGGADGIDGGAGVDTAVYTGLRSQYTVTRTGAGAYSVTGVESGDTLVNVERLKFSNGYLALDTAGNGGQA